MPPATKRQTIGLVMIVKDEADGLEETLRSVSRLTDQISIIDTGSTDRTREIALDLGALVGDSPFVDFAQARNVALEVGFSVLSAQWLLMLSGDDIAHGAPEIPDVPDGALFVDRREGGVTYKQAMLAQRGAGWRAARCVHQDTEMWMEVLRVCASGDRQ